ncbi:MAG: NRDE family protein [Bacteroidales bacterium]
MCTVSYIPQKGDENSFILTSNRDERVERPTLYPEIYKINNLSLCYPKDLKAGGSWIAVNDKGRLTCLLNGAHHLHEKKVHHTHSRGKVLLDIAASEEDPLFFFSYYDLSRTEPFTIITLDSHKRKALHFTEFIWDGNKKYLKELDPSQPHIWSSVTLYSKEKRIQKQEKFKAFLSKQDDVITFDEVFSFHSGKEEESEANDFLLETEMGLKTVSITQVIRMDGEFRIKYLDLIGNEIHLNSL